MTQSVVEKGLPRVAAARAMAAGSAIWNVVTSDEEQAFAVLWSEGASHVVVQTRHGTYLLPVTHGPWYGYPVIDGEVFAEVVRASRASVAQQAGR